MRNLCPSNLSFKADGGADFRNQHSPINNCKDIAKLNNRKCNNSDYDLCPCPPGSPHGKLFFFLQNINRENNRKRTKSDGEYEEFKAEINDNVLCVRVPKNAGIVRRVYDNESPRKGGSDSGKTVI